MTDKESFSRLSPNKLVLGEFESSSFYDFVIKRPELKGKIKISMKSLLEGIENDHEQSVIEGEPGAVDVLQAYLEEIHPDREQILRRERDPALQAVGKLQDLVISAMTGELSEEEATEIGERKVFVHTYLDYVTMKTKVEVVMGGIVYREGMKQVKGFRQISEKEYEKQIALGPGKLYGSHSEQNYPEIKLSLTSVTRGNESWLKVMLEDNPYIKALAPIYYHIRLDEIQPFIERRIKDPFNLPFIIEPVSCYMLVDLVQPKKE